MIASPTISTTGNAIAQAQKTNIPRTQQQFEKFDIRNFSDQLVPAKEKGKYVCPNCDRPNLTWDNSEPPIVTCWNGCDRREIKEAIKPWAEVLAEREGNNYTRSPRTNSPRPKTVKPKTTLIPDDFALAKLTEPATDIPRLEKLTAKPPKGIPGHAEQITYHYSENQWVNRYQWADKSKEKGYDKSFRQYRRLPDGTIEMKKGDEPWGAYRVEEVIAASKLVQGTPAALQHEGEGCVEAGREHGLAGFTFQGSEWDKKFIIPGYQRMKDSGIGLIVFLHDPDDTGLKKLRTCFESAAEVGIAFVGINPHNICPDLPYKSSDIKEILAQMETPEFILRLEEEIHAAVKERSQQLTEVELDEDEVLRPQDPILNFNQKAFEVLFGDKDWICANDRLYYHTGNHYKYSPDSTERPRITNFCNSYAVADEKGKITYPYAAPSSVKKVLEWVKLRVEIDPELINPPGVNCINGVVRPVWQDNKVTVRLDPHTPQDYFIYEPLIEYDPSADSTDCDRLLSCLDKPQQQVLLRNLAGSIDLETVRKLKGREIKALLAVGLGSNGKDAVREAVSTIYGHQGMTSISLADFQFYDDGRKFYLAPLRHSRINWASENPQTSRIDKIQSLKLFVTGNKLHCEHKGKDHVEFTPNAIGLFNLNEAPSFQGAMQASQDRFAVLEFLKTFKNNPDPNNPNELLADPRFAYDKEFIRTKVAPALLNKMLSALNDLIEFGIDYQCTTNAFRNLQKENNHLFEFIEATNLGYVPGSEMAASYLWAMLEEYYINNGTLVIEEESKRRTWIDQVRPSDKNVKGINQVIPRIAQLFPKAVKGTRYCDISKRNIPVLKGIGIIDPTRTTLEETRTTSAPLPAPETTQTQDFRTTRTTFPDFEKNIEKDIGESELQIDLHSPAMKKEDYPPQSGAGGAEPLQNKENCCEKLCESGAAELESGAGTPNQDEVAAIASSSSAAIITQGMRVRVHCLGSVRHGKVGTVKKLVEQFGKVKAIVNVEDVEAKNRLLECFIPGTEDMRLELLE